MLRILSASVLLNLVLLLMLLFSPRPRGFHPPTTAPAQVERSSAALQPAVVRPKVFWNRFESGDPGALASWLHSVHCPETIVRNLVTALINRRYEAQKEALRRIDDFWLDGPERDAEIKRRILALIAVEQQREKAIESTLGIPWYQAPFLDNRNDGWVFFTGLFPEDKGEAMLDILIQYQLRSAMFQALRETSPAEHPPSAGDQLVHEFNDALNQTLSPDQVDELAIRFFEVGYFDVWKQEQRFGMQLSPDELREALRILKPDAVVPPGLDDDSYTSTPSLERRLEKAQQLRGLLGDERFGILLQHHDGDFEGSPAWSNEGKPSPEVFVQLFQIEESVLRQVSALKADTEMSDALRQASLHDLIDQAALSTAALLPSSYYTNYLNAGGRWMRTVLDEHAP
jgi:hypothetical protein